MPKKAKFNLENALQYALDKGAQTAEIVHAEGTSIDVNILNDEMEKFEYSSSDALGVRIIIGQKQAMAHTSNLEEVAVKKIIDQAISMAKVAPNDEFLITAPKEDLISTEEAKIAQNKLDLQENKPEPSAKLLQETALEIERAALNIKGVEQSIGSWASYGKSKQTMMFSNGFKATTSSTSHSIGASMIAGKDDNMVREYHYSFKHHSQDLENPAEVGKKAGEKAVKRIGAISKNLGAVPVIFHHEIAGEILGELVSAINGSSIARGTSFLKNHLNKQIFKENITIKDNPLMIRGSSSRAFDDEGLKTKELNIVENGVLKSWILDLTTAKKLGLKSTSHASRGLSSAPHPSSSNFYMEKGKTHLQDMLENIKIGFLVTGTMGYGANNITGEYSQGAEGFLIENGKITQPIHNVTIAGNMLDIFSKLIPASDLEFKGKINSPSLLIEEGITVSGTN